MTMKKITDYQEVSPLVFRYFKRGVITNNFLSAEDYRCEIAEGRLFYKAGDDYLNMYIQRDGFFQLYFHALAEDVTFPEVSELLVCDIAGEPGKLMANNGFAEHIRRVKLERNVPAAEVFCSPHIAEKKDAKGIFALMGACFDKVTGYVPNFSQIEKECENGLFYMVTKEDKIAGVLRRGQSGKLAQIKHLCVDKEFRGQGIGKILCNEFLRENPKAIVWTGKENVSALNLYQSLGFAKSGLESIVYTKGR